MTYEPVTEKNMYDILKEKRMQQLVPGSIELRAGSIDSGAYSLESRLEYIHGGYRNKTNIANVMASVAHNWEAFPGFLYGTYNTLTHVVSIAEHLRGNLEEYFKTILHEVSLHAVMKLPDGYIVKALEEVLCAPAQKDERYKK